MERGATVLLISCCFLLGCSGPPTHENRNLPGLTLDGDLAGVRDAARDALKDTGFAVEKATDAVLLTPLAQARGFSWSLTVSFKREQGEVHVNPSLEINRERPFHPLRALGQNMSDAAIDDAHLEGGNGRAYSHDRDMIEGEDDRENAEREQKIDEIAHRVGVFLLRLENLLSKPK